MSTPDPTGHAGPAAVREAARRASGQFGVQALHALLVEHDQIAV